MAYVTVQSTLPPLLEKPQNLKAQLLSPGNSVSLSWDANTQEGMFSYRIFRNSLLLKMTTTTTILDSTLEFNNTYTYTVTNVDIYGRDSEPSSPVSIVAKDMVAPVKVQGLSIVAPDEGSKLILTWQTNAEEDLANYQIYRDSKLTAATTNNFFIDTSLTNGAMYTYQISAKDNTGNEGPLSDAARGTPEIISKAKATIKTPDEGKRVRGNAVTIMTEATEETTSVLFQYRTDGSSSTWKDISSKDEKLPFSVYWNVSALQNGKYWLQAIGFDKNNAPDPKPQVIWILIDDVNADIHEDGNPGVDPNKEHRKEERVVPEKKSEVSLADGTKAIIPAKTLTEPDKLVIRVIPSREVNPILPPPQSALKTAGVFREYKFESGVSKFKTPITIALPYKDANKDGIVDGTDIHEKELKLFYFNEKSKQWERAERTGFRIASWKPLGNNQSNSVINEEEKFLEAQVDHFTIFGLFAERLETTVSNVIVYPNPVLPSKGHKLTFEGLPATTKIAIYTIAGRLVIERELPQGGRWEWDLNTAEGEPAASGAYFYLVTSPNNPAVKGKIAIVR